MTHLAKRARAVVDGRWRLAQPVRRDRERRTMPRMVRVLLASASAECVRAVRRAAGNAQWVILDLDHRCGTEAIAAGLAEDPDVCLVDERLDADAGLGVVRQLRRAAKGVPVILLRGSDDASAVLARRAGADDCLLRDELTSEALERSILWVIEHHRAGRVAGDAEEAARIREAELRALVDRIPAGVARYDRDCRYVSVTAGIERLTQMTPAAFAGRTNRELGVPPEVCDEWDRAILSVFSTGKPATLEVEAPAADGPRRIELYLVPQADPSGRVESVIEVRRDVTEGRRLHEQLCQAQKMDLLGRLASGIAHDFGNVLTAILGYTQLIELTLAGDDPRRADVAEISAATARATDLTRQLLAFTRKGPASHAAIDLNKTVHSVGKMLRRLIPEDIDLSIRCQPDVGCARIDASSFERILLNLVVNARDAITGGGSIVLETENVSLTEPATGALADVPAGAYVAVSVSDTGAGIPEEVKARLFDPFVTTKEGGTGLGLSVVRDVVEQNGGHIVVESAPGRGSRFTVLLARADASADVIACEGNAGWLRGHEAILFVEDEPTLRVLHARLLRQQGYTVHEAQDGQEALDLIRDRELAIDLLIADVVMPRMGGGQLAAAVRAASPTTRVLFTSGYSRAEVLAPDGQSAGDDFIQKPFTAHALLRQIRALLDRTSPPVDGTPWSFVHEIDDASALQRLA